MLNNKYLNWFLTSFPIVVLIIGVIWFVNQYKTNKLQQRLAAMQIRSLEKELGIIADEKVVSGILNDNIVQKVSSKVGL